MTVSCINDLTLRVLDIVSGTSVDGPGLRTSIYLAGCAHACPGCHNPQSWDGAGGREMTIEELIAIIAENEEDVTLTGGDPLFQARAAGALAGAVKRRLGLGVWLYTGYTYEQIMSTPGLSEAVADVDVVVDGPFVAAQRDTTLRFRGSRNQRLVDMARSRPGAVVLWDD